MTTSGGLAEQVAVKQISPDNFSSCVFPKRMGNSAPIAYGGCTAAIAVHSACKTVKENFHAHSILGAFHGPTRIDRVINCTVTRTRDTKTFATRRVVATQTQDDGTERTCCDITVDFMVKEPAMFEYSPKPSRQWPGPYGEGTEENSKILENLVTEGEISREQADNYRKLFTMMGQFYETRQCVDGVSGHNFMGLAKGKKTSQDHLDITEKTSAEWQRMFEKFKDESEEVAALAFFMDGALSFLCLNHDHKNFEDGGACSTLDFALRIMRPGFKLNRWTLRERRTIAAAVGRTYAESRLWDEDGNLIAVESQSCIMRPLKTSKL